MTVPTAPDQAVAEAPGNGPAAAGTERGRARRPPRPAAPRPAAPRSGPRPRGWRVAGVLAGLILLAGLAAWLVWYSPVLGVRSVRVDGLVDVAPERVVEAAGVPVGTPLARVDAEVVRARVLAMPRMADVEVRRGWPNTLVLVVRERVAAGVLSAVDGWWLVDRDGDPFLRVALPPADLPVVRAAGPGVQTALQVVAGLPPRLTRTVEEVTATTRDDVTLRLRSGAEVRWGDAADGDLKGRVLIALLNRDATSYDVSAPGLPTTTG